jgi:hypothetical protein
MPSGGTLRETSVEYMQLSLDLCGARNQLIVVLIIAEVVHENRECDEEPE